MKNTKPSYFLKGAALAFSLSCVSTVAQANSIHFQAVLSGAAEAPPNASPGTGWADVYFDDVAQTMQVVVSFSGLLAGTTASHIHAATAAPNTGTAGVATQTPTFTGFPTGVTSGTYDHIFDLTQTSTFNGSYVTANGGTAAGASAALEAALLGDRAYLNIHSGQFPGGEIRGFLHNVPDTTSTLFLLSAALGGIAYFAKWRRIGVPAQTRA
ncbi:MAG: CHRD domain-containing protein [Nibricoccus sp.]